MKLSVILCTHNPREEYLARTAEGLSKQEGVGFEAWELLVIDNMSTPQVSEMGVNWPGNVRFIREEQLGLTPARLRGISEAKGEILLFVDDDNVLASDYLSKGLEIASAFPIIGAWGGATVGDYEVEPPVWFDRFSSFVGVRSVEAARWGNEYYQHAITPIGAGMFIRANVARHYLEVLRNDAVRRDLDRKGDSLISGGDTDMANTAIDMGFGVGVFPQLSLDHLISRSRLELPYLKKLARAIGASQTILRHFRPGKGKPIGKDRPLLTRFVDMARDFKSSKEARILRQELRRGWQDGIQILEKVSDENANR